MWLEKKWPLYLLATKSRSEVKSNISISNVIFYSTSGIVVVNETVTCPIGYYCLAGTKRADQYPCPRGTFGNDTGYDDPSDCNACTGKSASLLA